MAIRTSSFRCWPVPAFSDYIKYRGKFHLNGVENDKFQDLLLILADNLRAVLDKSIVSIKGLLPPGATFLEGKSAMIDQRPAALIYYDLSVKRVDLVITIRVMQLQTYYHNKFLTFTFSVGTNPGEEQTRPAVFEKFRPVFLLMANSIVLE